MKFIKCTFLFGFIILSFGYGNCRPSSKSKKKVIESRPEVPPSMYDPSNDTFSGNETEDISGSKNSSETNMLTEDDLSGNESEDVSGSKKSSETNMLAEDDLSGNETYSASNETEENVAENVTSSNTVVALEENEDESSTSTEDEEIILENQLIPGEKIPSEFSIEFSGTKFKSAEDSFFHPLKEIEEGHFVGYGKESIADFLEDGIPGIGENNNTPNDPIPLKECQFQDDSLFRVCASDGNTYENLGHFYCAQTFNKDLKRLWDGFCNRTQWPSGYIDEKSNSLIITNPIEIVRPSI